MQQRARRSAQALGGTMRPLKRARCTMTFGGPGSGWRPTGSAPYRHETQSLTLEICHSEEGYFLVSTPDNDDAPQGDTWHRSLEDALSQAQTEFGVAPADWVEIRE